MAAAAAASSSSLRLPQVDQPPTLRAAPAEREHMFDKALTTSDVGKLNRLVIPKQHAVKYFPRGPALDSSVADKREVLLCFEEYCTGKRWCFRYSFWGSSQTYVMTKGWSSFVRDKRLGAGDVISFSRSRSDVDDQNNKAAAAGHSRLFIDWHHRDKHGSPPLPIARSTTVDRSLRPWGGICAKREHALVQVEDGGRGRMEMGRAKRVRLFGVNLEFSEMESHGSTESAMELQFHVQ